MARAALDAAIHYARERKSFGKLIIQHQAWASGWPIWPRGWRRRSSWFCTPHRSRTRDCLPHPGVDGQLVASETAELVCPARSDSGRVRLLEEFGLAKIIATSGSVRSMRDIGYPAPGDRPRLEEDRA